MSVLSVAQVKVKVKAMGSLLVDPLLVLNEETVVPPDDESLTCQRSLNKRQGGLSVCFRNAACLECFPGFVLTMLDFHGGRGGKSWESSCVLPASSLPATPTVLAPPAVVCHLPDVIVGDLSSVCTIEGLPADNL